MLIISNKLIPFKGYRCINVFGVLFIRKGSRIDATLIRHEQIHTSQMKELGYIMFYVLYFVEYLIKLIYYHKHHIAYRAISFEREAYDNQGNVTYGENRHLYAWMKLIHKHNG